MTQQDKNLLLRDLSARLPYGVKITFDGKYPVTVTPHLYAVMVMDANKNENWMPYLRPMSSMTEEEKEEYEMLQTYPGFKTNHTDLTDMYDWLNKHHFDYRGMIEKGLAIEVTKENNPYK